MKQLKHVYICIVLSLSLGAWARDYSAGALRLKRPTADEARAGQRMAGVYLEIQNESTHADRLIAVSSFIAEEVVLHTVAGGASPMADAHYLVVPGKNSVALAPGTSHIMLTGLRRPLTNGDRFPLKLVFERAGTVLVDVLVVGPAATPRAPHHN